MSLYARRLTTGDIRAHLAETYGVEVFRDPDSGVADELAAWQSRGGRRDLAAGHCSAVGGAPGPRQLAVRVEEVLELDHQPAARGLHPYCRRDRAAARRVRAGPGNGIRRSSGCCVPPGSSSPRSWRSPPRIRKIVYTTNATESPNSLVPPGLELVEITAPATTFLTVPLCSAFLSKPVTTVGRLDARMPIVPRRYRPLPCFPSLLHTMHARAEQAGRSREPSQGLKAREMASNAPALLVSDGGQ